MSARRRSSYVLVLTLKSINSGVKLKTCKIAILLVINGPGCIIFSKRFYINSLLYNGIKPVL